MAILVKVMLKWLKEYHIHLVNTPSRYDAIILAVSHNEFLQRNIPSLKSGIESVVYDIKSCLDRELIDARL